jgi:hypothetical protein
MEQGLQMETISGFTDEALLGLAETSALAYWKSGELRKGSLSVRELIRRGNEIDLRIQERQLAPVTFVETGQAPLHPSLPQVPMAEGGHPITPWPSKDMRRVAADIYRESVFLYLHTVMSDCNPGKFSS